MITDKFNTRDELLKELESAIKEGEDGTFFLEQTGQEELTKQIETLTKQLGEAGAESKKHRLTGQDWKKKYETLESEHETIKATLEELQKTNPANLQEQLRTFASEKGELAAQLKKLTKTNEELNSRVRDFEARDTEAKIKEDLWKEAKTAGVRDDAQSVIKRMFREFHYNDAGLLESSDGKTASEFIAEEISNAPSIFLPASQGGGSAAGKPLSKTETVLQKADEAMKSGKVSDMIKAASDIVSQE